VGKNDINIVVLENEVGKLVKNNSKHRRIGCKNLQILKKKKTIQGKGPRREGSWVNQHPPWYYGKKIPKSI
jgi:hypothetical protein